MNLVVRTVRLEAVGVRSFRLEDEGGRALPVWEPGAHLEFVLPSGLIRHYSLCGDPSDRHGYEVAVLEQPTGRGGSMEFHAAVTEGSQIEVRGPRNHFPLGDGDSFLLLAGGIGITPLLPMARSLAASGRQCRVLYGGRSASSMAFRDAVSKVDGHVMIQPEDTHGRLDIAAELDRVPVGTNVYCCGPEPLLAAVEAICAGHPRVASLHFERFGATPGMVPPDAAKPSEQSYEYYEVELAASGTVVTVGPGDTILGQVLEARPDWPWSCREGFCGSCETRVLGGIPEHADDVLTAEERAAGEVMMICVGGSRSPRLILDI